MTYVTDPPGIARPASGPSCRSLALQAIADAYRSQVVDAFDLLVEELANASADGEAATNFQEAVDTAGTAYRLATKAIQQLMPQ